MANTTNKNNLTYSTIMRIKRIVLISFGIGFLSAPPSIASANNTFTFPYFETDGTLYEMSTWRLNVDDNVQFTTNELVGKLQDSQSSEHIAVFRYNNDKSFSLINLDNNQAINAINNETMIALGEAQKIKLYELNFGVIESAVYSSEHGVCKDYNSANGIRVNFATNYYPDFRPNTNTLFATIANFQLYDEKPVRYLSAENQIQVQDTVEKQEIEKLVADKGEEVLQADAIKLNSFINFLCDDQLTIEDSNL